MRNSSCFIESLAHEYDSVLEEYFTLRDAIALRRLERDLFRDRLNYLRRQLRQLGAVVSDELPTIK